MPAAAVCTSTGFTSRIAAALGVAAGVLFVAACGGGDDSASEDSGGADVETHASEDDYGQSEEVDLEADLDVDAELAAIAKGLEVSLQAERVEVDGDTIHIYVKQSDGVVAGAGSECVVASRVVPDEITTVVHRDGVETPC